MKPISEIFLAHCERDAKGTHIGGTDKQSNHWYGDAYESIFATQPGVLLLNYRQTASMILEVGVADGSSLLAWQEIFPNAKIVGMDVHVAEKAIRAGIEFHKGDQRSQDDCLRVTQGRLFDVIVEDAMHTLDNTLLTLFWLWPSVKPGGLYIVEEWANIGNCRANIMALLPNAEIVDTNGPFGGIEPLIVLRKK